MRSKEKRLVRLEVLSLAMAVIFITACGSMPKGGKMGGKRRPPPPPSQVNQDLQDKQLLNDELARELELRLQLGNGLLGNGQGIVGGQRPGDFDAIGLGNGQSNFVDANGNLVTRDGLGQFANGGNLSQLNPGGFVDRNVSGCGGHGCPQGAVAAPGLSAADLAGSGSVQRRRID